MINNHKKNADMSNNIYEKQKNIGPKVQGFQKKE